MWSIVIQGIAIASMLSLAAGDASAETWNDSELAMIRMQWVGNLSNPAPDPTNRYSDHPDAANLGHRFFFDRRFSSNGKVACATCHRPEKMFTDGLTTARGVGQAKRNTPSIIGISHSPWFFWDGRSDSQWSQALVPLEDAREHGGNRHQYARIIHTDPLYRKQYEAIFGPMPDLDNIERFPPGAAPTTGSGMKAWLSMKKEDREAITRVLVNMGKALAAYQRLLMPGPSRFDQFAASLIEGKKNNDRILSSDEVSGLKLFLGKGTCVTCHLGPLFTNHGFHNIGVPDLAVRKKRFELPLMYLFREKPPADNGRYDGIRKALKSPFNCLGIYSDSPDKECAELRYANTDHTVTLGAFKVPSLRNVSKTAPYMHAGQFGTLLEVLEHYNDPPPAPSGHTELLPLDLDEVETNQLLKFLHTLDSPVSAPARLLVPPAQTSR